MNMITKVTTTEHREKAYSLLYLGANIGLILSPIIAGFLFNSHGILCGSGRYIYHYIKE
ncbi:hypothetical protein SAMN06296386_106165 [Lachnospiraceae bacterium]|nr:hypothetical protein SAMN06296386_106165 [Lachnospiraceae bacterium]